MKADLSKVPFTGDELAAVESVVAVVDAVLEQAGPDDEELGIDADDIATILMEAFKPGTAAAKYVSGGKTPREILARAKNVFYGVERAYDLVGSAGIAEG